MLHFRLSMNSLINGDVELVDSTEAGTVKGQAKFELYSGMPADDQLRATFKKRSQLKGANVDEHRTLVSLCFGGVDADVQPHQRDAEEIEETHRPTPTCNADRTNWTMGLVMCEEGAALGLHVVSPIPSNTTYLIDHEGRYVHSLDFARRTPASPFRLPPPRR